MKKQTGFGLVELIVVVAILSILLLVGIPLFGAIRNAAYDASAESVLTTGGMQIEAGTEMERDRVEKFGILRSDFMKTYRLQMGPYSNYKNAYISSVYVNTAVVCEATTPTHRFVIMAASKSGKVFGYDSVKKSVQEFPEVTYFETPTASINPTSACQQAGFASGMRAYGNTRIPDADGEAGITIRNGWALFDGTPSR